MAKTIVKKSNSKSSRTRKRSNVVVSSSSGMDGWYSRLTAKNVLWGSFVVVVFAVLGTVTLLLTHAATAVPSGQLSIFGSKWCLDDNGGLVQQGNKVQLWQCNGTAAQRWDFYSDHTIRLHANTNYCLDDFYSGTTQATKVWLYTCNGTVAQQWTNSKNNAGMTAFVNPHANMCLDDDHAMQANGNKVQIWPCNRTAAQGWTMPTATAVPTPGVNLSVNPSTISVGQSATLSWSSTSVTSCTASGAWTGSKATSGSQTVSPSSSASYVITCSGSGGSQSATAALTVNQSPPNNGGGIACKTTLSGSQNGQLLSNTYHVQANEWASGAPLSICTDGNADFKIANSAINNATSGAPGAYPSLYKGCHWGYCTSNSGLPIANTAFMNASGKVTTSYATTVISTGAWDDAYDNWYNPSASTSSNNTGLEMMIWINHHGPIQPAGSVATTNAVIDGMSWTVWHGGSSPGGTVSYVLNSPTTSVTNMDLGPFTVDSVARGYMTSAWYLIDVEAGFEPWQGGTGLTANSFNLTVH